MKNKKNLRSFLSKIFGTKKKDPVPEKEIPVPDSEKSIYEEAEKTFPESGEKINSTETDWDEWRKNYPYTERTGAFVINIPSSSGGYYKKKKKPSDDPEDQSSDSKE